MRMCYFGDSYDFVKRSFIAWLHGFGRWYIQPMFTEMVTANDAERYASFMGAAIVSSDQLSPETNRTEFFASSREAGNLFLDPDVGIRAKLIGKRSPCYLAYSELSELVKARPGHITMVYDQSVSRSNDEARRKGLTEKLEAIRSHGVFGCYYVSHAPILIASGEPGGLEAARENLLVHLPARRILCEIAPST